MILIDFSPSLSWFHGSITSITCTLSDVRPNPEGADSKRESALRYKAGDKGRPEFLQNQKQDVKCSKLLIMIFEIYVFYAYVFFLPVPTVFLFMAALRTCSVGTRQVFVRLRRGVKQCQNCKCFKPSRFSRLQFQHIHTFYIFCMTKLSQNHSKRVSK